MAVGALESATLRPSAVPVHHRSDVHRNSCRVETRDVHRARLPPVSRTAGTIGDPMANSDRLVANALAALESITAALPAGEARQGQIDMAEAITS